MRVSFSLAVIALLILSSGTLTHAQTGTLTINLMLGSTGAQVTALQQMLNRDPSTRVAATGAGSPGNETSYFGLLTKAAVIRFQEKYASEVLAPAGLSQGSGYVGFYTRSKLNALSTLAATPAIPTAPTLPIPTPAPTDEPQNPNLKNLDKFLAAIDTVAAQEGISTSELAKIKEEVLEAVATTTDLRATFIKLVEASTQTAQDDSLLGKVFAAVENTFNALFMPERAYAVTGVSFGGALLFPFFCEDSVTWLLTIQPLPPTYVTLLSYVPGSQAYLSYNIPATRWLLGDYTPTGICVFACPSCVFIPAQGTITPKVGSSPQ